MSLRWSSNTPSENPGYFGGSCARTVVHRVVCTTIFLLEDGGSDDGGGDSGGSSWSSEVGRVPPLMPGTAAPVTMPAPGGVDDANDAPMAIGGQQRGGGGE